MTQAAHSQDWPNAVPQLGPDSLLWRYGGDRRIYLLGPLTGLMLNMQPEVSAAIMDPELSVFFDEPWERTMRSITQIVEGVYDQDMATRIRDYHREIKGHDHHGRRFHALDPELYFASHAIFVYTVITHAELFAGSRPLTVEEKEAFYDECKTWYRSYGVSDRAMPDTWDEFVVYFEELCRNLEATPSARRIVDGLFANGRRLRPHGVPSAVWWLVGPVVADHARLLAAGSMPPEVRQTIGLSHGRVDQIRYRALIGAINRVWPLLPERLREVPVAREAKRRS